jgi:FtsZ-binding cell division protein ZapB
MSEPNTEWDNVPASRVLPAWREQVRKLSLEINDLWDKNQSLKSEVKRLTEAGDAMAAAMGKFTEKDDAVEKWKTVKDGLDSK